MLKSQTTKKSKRALFLFLQTAFVIFGLAGAFVGTYAWFTSNTTVENKADFFTVMNDSISIDSVTLTKFNYRKLGEVTDYLTPSYGTVGTYDYDETDKRFEDGGVEVVMNRFDPIRMELGDTLRDQYCNAVYKVTVVSDYPTSPLKIFANHVAMVKVNDSDIFLTDCLDFDVYTSEEVAAISDKYFSIPVTSTSQASYVLTFFDTEDDENPYFTYTYTTSTGVETQDDIGVELKFEEFFDDDESNHFALFSYTSSPFRVTDHTFDTLKLGGTEVTDIDVASYREYYPGYIEDNNITDPTFDPNFSSKGTDAELFYKIGYLSSKEESHAHFYGLASKDDPLPIHNPLSPKTLTYTSRTATFYVNVNYAPKQLEQYSLSLADGERIALRDYYFSIDV